LPTASASAIPLTLELDADLAALAEIETLASGSVGILAFGNEQASSSIAASVSAGVSAGAGVLAGFSAGAFADAENVANFGAFELAGVVEAGAAAEFAASAALTVSARSAEQASTPTQQSHCDPVPEPSALLAFGAALIAWATWRIRLGSAPQGT
jgi:hypothetical protein